MKYKVIDGFLDIKTNEYRAFGEILTDKEERIEDFLKAGVINALEEEKEFTVKEIKSLLDEKGIEYDKKSSKDELIKLLEGVE